MARVQKTELSNMSKCHHAVDVDGKPGYVQWHSDSEKRHRKGQRQVFCPTCCRYLWPHEFRAPGEKKT
jgi:hypothetical protein